ncbi:hypothetical protein [Streptomyces sp. NPDC059224]|uniref:hypothetical protein n=1 Tax=Streptomyces sp. NPDC059224 TaxID=3346775 RepID=UPI0036BF17BB
MLLLPVEDVIGHLVDNGIKRPAMPADCPPWDRVHAFFRRRRDHWPVKECRDRPRAGIRAREGRDTEHTAGAVDSRSVKADVAVGSDSRRFDGGKLINGRRRHVVVHTPGLLLGVTRRHGHRRPHCHSGRGEADRDPLRDLPQADDVSEPLPGHESRVPGGQRGGGSAVRLETDTRWHPGPGQPA